MEERAAVERLKRGDIGALEVLMRRYYTRAKRERMLASLSRGPPGPPWGTKHSRSNDVYIRPDHASAHATPHNHDNHGRGIPTRSGKRFLSDVTSLSREAPRVG
jgi:hypothetical protein